MLSVRCERYADITNSILCETTGSRSPLSNPLFQRAKLFVLQCI